VVVARWEHQVVTQLLVAQLIRALRQAIQATVLQAVAAFVHRYFSAAVAVAQALSVLPQQVQQQVTAALE
jgi:hypothetical protein